MERIINSASRAITDHWENATPTDFGALALGIVIISWFSTRFYGDR